MDAKFLHADNELWSDWTDAQADLSLRSVHMSKGTFSHVEAHRHAKTCIRAYADSEGPDKPAHSSAV